MSGPDCKLCIVGPCRAGKTLLCKVATGQALYPTDMYEPTADAGVRIQAYTTGKAGKGARAELWDCSGDASLAPLWPTLSEGVDGLVLVHSDATRAQEAALEAMYKAFAQAHRITRTRCLVLSCGPLAAGGLTGKLKALPQQAVDLDAAGGPQAAAPRVRAALDALIAQCVQHRAAREEEELAERASSGDEA